MDEDNRRARLGLGELSAEAKAARAPLRPEELIEAQHDRVHRDPGRARAASLPTRWRVLRDRDGREIYRSLRRSWRDVVQDAIRAGVDLRGAVIRGRNLEGLYAWSVCFDGADLRDSILDRAVLERGSFVGADMRGVSMRGARVFGAVFAAADMRGARMDGVRGRYVDFLDADMRGVSMDETEFEFSRFDGALTGDEEDGAHSTGSLFE